MNAYYVQKADKINPIFGVNSIQEAKDFSYQDKNYVIGTSEKVYMNLATGSVGFESDWGDLSDVVEVVYDVDCEDWVEVNNR